MPEGPSIVIAREEMVSAIGKKILKVESNRRGPGKNPSFSQRMVCDVLMDQNIFSGVGNIIKNEVLFIPEKKPVSGKDSAIIVSIVRYDF